MRVPSPRWLIGRTIVGYSNNTERDPEGGELAHFPVITLDNGATLSFDAAEVGMDVFAVEPRYTPPRRRS